MEGRPLEPVTDDELIERAKRGEVRAYEALVERYRRVAVRAAYVVCRSSADAEVREHQERLARTEERLA